MFKACEEILVHRTVRMHPDGHDQLNDCLAVPALMKGSATGRLADTLSRLPLWGISDTTFPVLKRMYTAVGEVELIDQGSALGEVFDQFSRTIPRLKGDYDGQKRLDLGEETTFFHGTNIPAVHRGGFQHARPAQVLPAGVDYRVFYGIGCFARGSMHGEPGDRGIYAFPGYERTWVSEALGRRDTKYLAWRRGMNRPGHAPTSPFRSIYCSGRVVWPVLWQPPKRRNGPLMSPLL